MIQPNPIVWSPGVALETLIQQVVETAMVFYKGNKTAAAQSLGIAVRTLDNRLEKYAKEKSDNEQRYSEAKTKREQFIARQRAIPIGAQFDTSATPSVYTAEVARRRQEASSHAKAGVRAEPLANAAPQQSLPVHEPKEIQSVLPSKAAGNRSKGNG